MSGGVLRAAVLAGIVALSVPALWPALSSAAAPPDTSLDGRVIRSVRIVAHDIYHPVPAGRASELYRLANRLHVRSRHGTVRSALVFREGDRWSDAARAESERRLRTLTFLTPDSISATSTDDSVDVRVVTHDNWTTSPEFNLERGGGQQFGSFAFTERNLLGMGTSLSVSRHSEPAGLSSAFSVEDRGTLGSRWRTKFATGSGAAGRTHEVIVELPFWSEAAPYSLGAEWSRNVSVVHLFADLVEAAHVPKREESVYLYAGIGRRETDGSIRRLKLFLRASDRELGATILEPGAPAEFAGAPEQSRMRRVGLEGTYWRPRFIERQGIESIDRVEDIDIGRSFSLMAGLSPKAFGGTADEGYLRAGAHVGAEARGEGFGLVGVGAYTRLRRGPLESFGQLDARWVQPTGSRLTAVAAVQGAAGLKMPRDFQLTVGGLNGLRAFPVRELSGTRYWRANAEWRGVAKRDIFDVVSIGGAVFWDTARSWGPGSDNEGWHHDAGFGLRLSLPHSSLNAVARFDIAWPISPSVDGRHGAVYSFGSGQAF